MEILFWVAGILLFLFGTTFILKKTIKPMTVFNLVSIVKTQRFLPLLDRFAKHKRLLNWFADIGFIFCFGAVAVDYRFGRGKSKPKRIGLFILGIGLMYLLMQFLSVIFPIFEMLFSSPLFSKYDTVIRACFLLFGLSGVIVSILAAYALYIVENTLLGKKVCPGIMPIIPGVQIPKVPFVVPLHAWISFLIILVIHEGMHGILARRIGVKIKSAGVLLAGIFPIGAFVEPDEKQLASKPGLEQIRMYIAGPAANFFASVLLFLALFLFALLFLVPVFGPWVQEVRANSIDAVIVTDVQEKIDFCGQPYENPAFGKLRPGMQILRIGDYNVTSASGAFTAVSYALEEKNRGPFEVGLLDEQGAFLVETITPNELGMVSFSVEDKMNPNYTVPENYNIFMFWAGLLGSFFNWLILLSFLIALVNLLPIEPFDGGKIAKAMLLPYLGFLGLGKEATQKLIGRVMLWFIGFLLIINVLPFFL